MAFAGISLMVYQIGMSSIDLSKLSAALNTWAAIAVKEFGAEAVYVFGSLVHKGGAQFEDSSDVDLVVIMPEMRDADARYRWIESFSAHKAALELQLFVLLRRLGDEPIVSVVAVTRAEIDFDIHKDGHREFFSASVFRDLNTASEQNGIPGAGSQTPSRFLAAAFGFAQKVRNKFLAVSPNQTPSINAFEGLDPLPKDFMRAAAMAAREQDDGAAPGAEYDVKEGLEAVSSELRLLRKAPAWMKIEDLVAVRRRARGKGGPLEPSDQLLLAELIYNMALGGQNNPVETQSKPSPNSSYHGSDEQKDIILTDNTAESSASNSAAADFEAVTSQMDNKNPLSKPKIPHGSSTAFFHERFTNAFPGVREVTWYEDTDEIAARLQELLKNPLVFSDGIPIWWWRGGNLHIENFERQVNGIYLMNYEELSIRRIAAAPGDSYKKHFLYVEARAMDPTGLYDVSPDDIQRQVSHFGYANEEYGLFQGSTYLTRAEYDDGAKWINGKIVNTTANSSLRVRYITPYNFIIAANGSPINNPRFDSTLESALNKALQNNPKPIIEELKSIIEALPLRSA